MTETTVPAQASPRSGRIDYTARAAVQDSSLAMGGDVVRALVELITNSSDSYLRMERRRLDTAGGRIEILVDRTRRGEFNRIVVRDHAQGMRRGELDRKLLRLGGRTSEGGDRGLFGRGARDVAAFGKVLFESIQDGVYSTVLIHATLDYEGFEDERPATAADRERMGLAEGENGTQVTLYVRRGQHTVPQHATLVRRLSNTVQLRRIMTSTGRTVSVRDLGRSGDATVLHYTPPTDRTLVLELPVEVPGIPEAGAHGAVLRLYRCTDLLEDDRTQQRHSGILIDDGSAVHEATYFGYEGRGTAPLRFVGELLCPYIRILQDRWDETLETGGDGPENPVAIISRTRAGISRDHPFYARLAAFVDAALKPLVDEEEADQARTAGKVTDDTRKRLRDAARQLGSKFAEEARRLELDLKDHGSMDVPPGTPPVTLKVVPPAAYLEPEQTATFTVVSYPEAWEHEPDPWIITLTVLDDAVVSVSATEVALEIDARDPARRRCTFQVTAGAVEDATLVEVRLGSESETITVEVAAGDTDLPPAPNRLMFAQSTYRLRPGRPKTLVLMAPEDAVGTAGRSTVSLTTTSSAIQIPPSVDLELRDAGDGRRWWEAEVAAHSMVEITGRVRAALGQQSAVCQIMVTDPDNRNPFDFDLKPEAPRYDSHGRAMWSYPKGVLTLNIYTQHRSLQPYFGNDMARQGTLECRVLIAEIIAAAVATRLLQDTDRKAGGTLTRDAETYNSLYNTIVAKFLPTAHRALVPEFAGDSK